MATHSSVAWRSPWTEEAGGLSTGSQRVRHDWLAEHTCNDINRCVPSARRFFHVPSELPQRILNVFRGEKGFSDKVSGRFFWFYALITSCSCSHRTPGPLRQEMRGRTGIGVVSPQTCQSLELPGTPTVDGGSPTWLQQCAGRPVIAEESVGSRRGRGHQVPPRGGRPGGETDLSPPGSLQAFPSLSSPCPSRPVSVCPVSVCLSCTMSVCPVLCLSLVCLSCPMSVLSRVCLAHVCLSCPVSSLSCPVSVHPVPCPSRPVSILSRVCLVPCLSAPCLSILSRVHLVRVCLSCPMSVCPVSVCLSCPMSVCPVLCLSRICLS